MLLTVGGVGSLSVSVGGGVFVCVWGVGSLSVSVGGGVCVWGGGVFVCVIDIYFVVNLIVEHYLRKN